ncbi:MAG: DEAD/DEAH box helicase, partial [Candidatus Aminicenantales bacterium]
MRLYADVVLDLPIPGPFTYRVPGPLHPRTTPGIRVRVPFRRRAMTGVVVSLRKKRPASSFEMKEILEALDEGPVFSSEFLAFTRKLSASYHSSWGEMLLSALPASLVLRSRKEVAITPEGQKALEEGSLQEAEKTVLEIVEHRAYTTTFLRRKARVENVSAVLRRLEKKGLIAFHEILKTPVRKHRAEVSRPPLQLEIDFSLDERSLYAGKRLRAAMNSRKFSPFYVHASSGKREGIYAYLIREALASKRKVLFLVPEISLTSSLQKSFERKLGERALLFHSRLTEAQREQAWRRVREGGADVVVGSRSALFSPVENLGVIIVDDEHEEAYQQRESPSFDARKGAWLRAEQTASLLVYGSSVPSVEMYHRARRRGMILRL